MCNRLRPANTIHTKNFRTSRKSGHMVAWVARESKRDSNPTGKNRTAMLRTHYFAHEELAFSAK